MAKEAKILGQVAFSAAELAAEMYDRLPPAIHVLSDPIVRFVRSATFALTELKLEVRQQRCVDWRGTTEFDSTYIGRASCAKEIEKLFRYRVLSETRIESLFPWQVKSYVRRRGLSDTLTIVHLSGLFSNHCRPEKFLNLPPALHAIFQNDFEHGEAKSQFSVNVRRKIKKMDSLGISWRICGDNESARIFYKQLYLPHAQRRFGDHAVIFGLMKVRRLQRTGYLVMIFKDRELISGFICRIVGGRLVLELVGTAWTDEQPVSQVAGDAIYYVLLELARQLCCDRVDYRDCRPFMNDGVLRYKQQWGGVLSRQDTARRGIAISTPLQSPTGRRFFVGNYPIFEDGDGLSALLVLDGESPAGLRQLKRLEKAYLKPGLKRLGVSSPAGFEGEARRYLDAPGCRLADFEAIRI